MRTPPLARRAGLLAGALLAAASLTACGGDDGDRTRDDATLEVPATTEAEAPTAAPATGEETAEPTASPSAAETSAEPADAGDVPLIDTLVEPVAPDMTKDDAGALAFTNYAIDVLNYAYATGDSAPLHEIYDPAATHLATVAGTVDQIGDGGLTQYGGDGWMDMTQMISVGWPSEDVATVTFTLQYAAGEVRDSSGQVLHQADGGFTDVVYELEWRGEEWIIVDATQA